MKKNVNNPVHAIKSDRRAFTALVLPSFIMLFVLTVIPLIFTLVLSTTNYSISSQNNIRFLGLDNYISAFRDGKFWHSVLIMLFQSSSEVFLQMVLGLIMALLLHRKFRGVKACRALFILPWAVAPVVAGLMWRMLLNTELGWINYFVRLFGGSSVNWLGDHLLANISIIIANTWIATPAVGIMILAALQAISPDFYDAAKVDGANVFHQFLHIVLPLIKPTAILALLIRLMDALRQFDVTYVMTGGGPGNATESLNLYAYNQTFKYWRIGYGSSISTIMLFVIAIVSIFLLGIVNRAEDV